jgi:hypothetical protein
VSRKQKRPILGSRKNPETGKLECYEMTPEELGTSLEWLKNLPLAPPPEPEDPEEIDLQARRGESHGWQFLAELPSQERLYYAYESSWDETMFGPGDLPGLAYEKEFRKVLRTRLS